MPRVHVALMGIERIVPTLADLGVMLQVLGRSATGQKLTVYSNIITGPRRRGDGADRDESDGPDHLHIVLVDNGRSRLLGTDLAEVLYCIRCGACLNACPVYQEIGGHAYGSVYPGPVGAVLTPGLRGLANWHDLPHASSLCGACREICPVRIDIPRMLLKLRDEATKRGYSPAWITSGLWMFRQVATRPRLFRRAQALASFATRRLATNGWIHIDARSFLAVDAHARLPGLRATRASCRSGSADRDERRPLQHHGRRCRSACVRASCLPRAVSSIPARPPIPASALSRDELIAHFTTEAEALTVVSIALRDDAAATATVSALVADRGATRVLAWDDKWLNCGGLADALRSSGIALEPCWLPRESVERRQRLAELDDVRVGLTGAVAGLADTGSLALVSGPGRGRIASLLPPLHIAMLRVSQLHPTYAAFLAAHPQIEDAGSNLVLITGPSRTADIEMTLTRGVHGPGEVHVVLID